MHDGLEEELAVELAEARLAEAHDTAAARVGLAVGRGHDDVERVLAVAPELLESDGAAGGAGCRCLTVEALGLATATDLVDVLGCRASEPTNISLTLYEGTRRRKREKEERQGEGRSGEERQKKGKVGETKEYRRR